MICNRPLLPASLSRAQGGLPAITPGTLPAYDVDEPTISTTEITTTPTAYGSCTVTTTGESVLVTWAGYLYLDGSDSSTAHTLIELRRGSTVIRRETVRPYRDAMGCPINFVFIDHEPAAGSLNYQVFVSKVSAGSSVVRITNSTRMSTIGLRYGSWSLPCAVADTAYGAAAWTSDTSWGTEATVTLRTYGGPVLLCVSGVAHANVDDLGYRLLRDGTEIAQWTCGDAQGGTDVPHNLAAVVVDEPSAGSHTYELQFQDGAEYRSWTIDGTRQLAAVELRAGRKALPYVTGDAAFGDAAIDDSATAPYATMLSATLSGVTSTLTLRTAVAVVTSAGTTGIVAAYSRKTGTEIANPQAVVAFFGTVVGERSIVLAHASEGSVTDPAYSVALRRYSTPVDSAICTRQVAIVSFDAP